MNNRIRESLPFPSLQDEEVVLLAHQGDSTATEALLLRYRPLVESKARSFFLQGADREDVVQEGMIGLCKAIRDYREDRAIRFRPFAELCVKRQIISAVKAATRHKHVPLNGSLSLNAESTFEPRDDSLLEMMQSGLSSAPTEDSDSRVPACYREIAEQTLSALELSVLECYLSGKSYLEMGEVLHCRTKTIDNAIQRIKKKMSGALAD